MANGNLSPAGQQLFSGTPGLGDILKSQQEDEVTRLRRLRQQAGQPGLTGVGGSSTSLLAGPLGNFGLR
jgi:hypothetical protein